MLPTVLFQRNVVLNSSLLEKWLQLGNLFSNFAAAFKIIGPKPASNGSVRRIKFNWEIHLAVTLKLWNYWLAYTSMIKYRTQTLISFMAKNVVKELAIRCALLSVDQKRSNYCKHIYIPSILNNEFLGVLQWRMCMKITLFG